MEQEEKKIGTLSGPKTTAHWNFFFKKKDDGTLTGKLMLNTKRFLGGMAYSTTAASIILSEYMLITRYGGGN